MSMLSLPLPSRSMATVAAIMSACLLLADSRQSAAQPIDIAEQARRSRDQLTAEVGAVEGAALRTQLVALAPNANLVHWYAGEVLVDDQWLTLTAAQALAAKDKHLLAYRELRQKAADSLKDHERLARWCQKHDQTELAKMHWLHVLRFDPQYRAALRELQLTWRQGILLTEEEAKQYRQRKREWLKENKAWRAKAKRLRRDLEQGELARVQAARKELLEIDEAAALPALLEQFAEPGQTEQVTIARRMQLVSVLGGIASAQASDALVELAVESAEDSIRYSAIDQLKAKPLETYVPALLAEMAMPVDASVSINQIGNQIVNHYSYSQETPYGEDERDYQTSLTVPGSRYIAADIYRHRTIQKRIVIPGRHRDAYMCNGHRVPAVNIPERTVVKSVKQREYVTTKYGDHPEYQANRQRTVHRSRARAGTVGNQLAQWNDDVVHRNQRIANVLIEVTGETLSAYPKSWWNWWGDYLDRHPAVGTLGSRQHLNAALLNQATRGLAHGTWVWTRQGKQPVEAVLPGDYVLAQDPQTGELAYQTVMAIARPQQLTVTKVEFDDDIDLHCAPGHVVWTTASGWQRVSNLEAGQSLHGAITESRIMQVEPAFDINSYDLIVDGFHTFFVGESGLLVHDATPIGPADVALPGFSPAAVAAAAQQAAQRQ